jgi:hypothetical protein
MAALVGPLCGKWETHIHDVSNTYVPFPQLFAEGKSLKSEGIGMPRDKNKGLHANCLIWPQLGHAEPKTTKGRGARFDHLGRHFGLNKDWGINETKG